MLVLRDSSSFPPDAKGAVVALGNFDGLHVGHRAVIGTAVTLARQAQKPAMVMTFEPHPRRLFRPETPNERILRLREKIGLIREMGVDFMRIVRFTRAFAKTTAEEFVRDLLHGQLHVSRIVTGEDFVFGYNREGDVANLRERAGALGIGVTACLPVMVEGSRCSSTRIREAMAKGDMEQARLLLGRPYRIAGPVRHGDRRGRELGFPTANILPPPTFLPACGIYAVRARVRGVMVEGVANLGVRPDYPLAAPLLEAHLFDWRDELYGERVAVELVHYLREERKFASPEALKIQIAEDCRQAKAFLAGA